MRNKYGSKLPIEALLTVSVALLSLSSAQASPSTPAAIVKQASGTVWKTATAGTLQPIAKGVAIQQGETLTTGLDSAAEISFGTEGRTITLAGNSTVRIELLTAQPGALRLNLLRGALIASVGELAPGCSFEVQMPNGMVTALASKPGADLKALYDARSGNVYNLAATDSTVSLVGSLAAPSGTDTDTARAAVQRVTLNAGERLVMPTSFASVPTDESLAAAVSTIPTDFNAVSTLNSLPTVSDTSDGSQLAATQQDRRGNLSQSAVRRRPPPGGTVSP